MKKIFLFLMLWLYSVTNFAANINQVAFFGDSLSDDGNLYKLFFQLIPKSPPYFQGRFSNGPTWAEYVGRYFYDKNAASYKIYAYGGATVILHSPSKHFSPTLLPLEIDKYLIDSLFKTKEDTLFSIWIGGNDYLFYLDEEPQELTNNVVQEIVRSISRLIDEGGRYFVIFNLPDLSKIPFARNEGVVEKLASLTIMHNQKLAMAIQNLSEQNPQAKIIFMDMYSTFNDVMLNTEKYNAKYHVNITNTTDACWQDTLAFKGMILEQTLTNDLHALVNKKEVLTRDFDSNMLRSFILNSPAIQKTYLTSKTYELGNMPCTNANEYLFWDFIHPTAIVHEVLAKVIMEQLDMALA